MVRKDTPKNTIDGIDGIDQQSEPDIEYQESNLVYKASTGGDGVVDKVLITSNQDETIIIKVLIRQTRIPELGDKLVAAMAKKACVVL